MRETGGALPCLLINGLFRSTATGRRAAEILLCLTVPEYSLLSVRTNRRGLFPAPKRDVQDSPAAMVDALAHARVVMRKEQAGSAETSLHVVARDRLFGESDLRRHVALDNMGDTESGRVIREQLQLTQSRQTRIDPGLAAIAIQPGFEDRLVAGQLFSGKTFAFDRGFEIDRQVLDWAAGGISAM